MIWWTLGIIYLVGFGVTAVLWPLTEDHTPEGKQQAANSAWLAAAASTLWFVVAPFRFYNQLIDFGLEIVRLVKWRHRQKEEAVEP